MKTQSVVIWDEEVRHQVLQWLASYSLDPLRPAVVTLEPYQEEATDEQRGYYQTVVLKVLCDHTGYRKHEMHEFLKQEFGSKAHMEIGRRKREVSTFTTSRKGKKDHMRVFLDMVIQWANGELGLYIPPPTHDR